MDKKQKKSRIESYTKPDSEPVDLQKKKWLPSINDNLSKSIALSSYQFNINNPAYSKNPSDKVLYSKILKFNNLCNEVLKNIEELEDNDLLSRILNGDKPVLVDKLKTITSKQSFILETLSKHMTENKKRGRTPDYQLNEYISDMIINWKRLSGNDPKVSYNDAKGIYVGRFFDFIYDSLKEFGYKPLPSNPALGKKIQRLITKQKKVENKTHHFKII